MHWQIDQNFKQEQERLKIPLDPEEWYVNIGKYSSKDKFVVFCIQLA